MRQNPNPLDKFFLKTGKVLAHDIPQETNVDAMGVWMSNNFPGGEEILRNTDLEDLRVINSRRSRLDRAVLNLPTTKIGEFICVSLFRKYLSITLRPPTFDFEHTEWFSG